MSAIGKSGTFWMYAGCGVVAVTFFWRRIPETKGRSLEQIERDVRNSGTGPHLRQAA